MREKVRVAGTLALLLALVAAAACRGDEVGGAWCKALTTEQRDGYLVGYFDCYVFDRKGRKYPGGSRRQWIQAVSDYYRRHASDASLPVATIFHRINTGTPPVNPGSLERHSYFDGEYWRQATPPARQEFVRGYLTCGRGSLVGAHEAAVERYSEEVTRWYGVSKSDPAAVDSAREGSKIADVMHALNVK